MICPSCGLTNRPYHADCAFCSRVLQDDARAAEQRRRWDELSPAIRAEYEQDFDRHRKVFDEHAAWLRRNRNLHGVLGAVLVTIFMNLAFAFQLWVGTPVDLIVGIASGVQLNRMRGGGLRGIGLFALAAGIALGVRLPFLGIGRLWAGWFLTAGLALVVISSLGYYMGLRLATEHIEH